MLEQLNVELAVAQSASDDLKNTRVVALFLARRSVRGIVWKRNAAGACHACPRLRRVKAWHPHPAPGMAPGAIRGLMEMLDAAGYRQAARAEARGSSHSPAALRIRPRLFAFARGSSHSPAALHIRLWLFCGKIDGSLKEVFDERFAML